MSFDPIPLLLDVIDQAFDRKSWHGTNLRGSVRRVDHEQAIWRPGPQRKSIWEITLHAAYWKYTVRRRLLGEKRGSFPLKGSDWFTPAETTAAAWRDAVDLLVETHRTMREAIAGLPPEQLRKSAAGSETTNFALITGIAAHDLYHAGQIQLLKKLYADL